MSRPSRYELTDLQWNLPGKAGDPGRSGADNRLFVNAVLWVPRSGARWSDLPERYGKYMSVHKRFTRWAAAGVWDTAGKGYDSRALVQQAQVMGAMAVIPPRSCPGSWMPRFTGRATPSSVASGASSSTGILPRAMTARTTTSKPSCSSPPSSLG